MQDRTSDERHIRRLIDDFAAAFRRKEIVGGMSLYAPGIVSFDLVAPLRYVGAQDYRKPWEETFASCDGPIEYDVHDCQITSAPTWRSAIV